MRQQHCGENYENTPHHLIGCGRSGYRHAAQRLRIDWFIQQCQQHVRLQYHFRLRQRTGTPAVPRRCDRGRRRKVVDQLFAGLVTYDVKGGIHNEVLRASPPATMPRIMSSRLRRDGSSPTARRSPLIHSLMPGTTPPTVPTSRVAPASSAPFRVMTICRSRMLTRAQRSPV